MLAGLDWSNLVVAGSSALLPLLSRRVDVDLQDNSAVEKPAETYYQYLISPPLYSLTGVVSTHLRAEDTDLVL